jgi:hypothetical protein
VYEHKFVATVNDDLDFTDYKELNFTYGKGHRKIASGK